MATPRRRIIRFPVAPPPTAAPRRLPSLAKLRARVAADRAALARWWTRLRRAFHAITKLQRSITRLERQLQRAEDS